jgi:SAM-dependent methyltransferase
MSTKAWKYWFGDLFGGAFIGVVVALVHHALVPRSLGILGGAILGMFVGMAAQMVVSALLGSFLGAMEMMIPGMIVGMLGMFLPMLLLRELSAEVGLGAALGLVVFLGFDIWDTWLQRRDLTVGPPKAFENTTEKVRQISGSPPGWWNSPRLYNALESAGSKRRAAAQKELFQAMDGKVLFAAAGTGLNFANFPPGKDIVAIDMSREMLDAARPRAACYQGCLCLQEADLEQLPFANESFDTVATASTLCSVANPVKSLRELHRVLKPGGRLLMFEHVRSRNPILALELDLMNAVLHRVGPEMNRDTVSNVQRAGFVIDRIRCAYLDIFLAIEAHKPTLVAVAAA